MQEARFAVPSLGGYGSLKILYFILVTVRESFLRLPTLPEMNNFVPLGLNCIYEADNLLAIP
jgi:hypothetical protein